MAIAKNGEAETSSRNNASSLVRYLLLHSRNHKTEYNPFGIPIICPDISAMGLDNLSADGEPEPSAAGAGFGLAALHKFIEHHIQFRLGDTRAIIGNRAAKRFPAVWQMSI